MQGGAARQWKSSRAKPTFQSVACVATVRVRRTARVAWELSGGADRTMMLWADDGVRREARERSHACCDREIGGWSSAHRPWSARIILPGARDDVATERRATSSLAADRRYCSQRVNLPPSTDREIPRALSRVSAPIDHRIDVGQRRIRRTAPSNFSPEHPRQLTRDSRSRG